MRIVIWKRTFGREATNIAHLKETHSYKRYININIKSLLSIEEEAHVNIQLPNWS
jgi:hypothetical protein